MKDLTAYEQAPPAPPCIFVIFGAGGDLTKRKLIPALYNLATQGLLPERFALVGVDRVEFDNEGFRNYLQTEVREHLGGEFDQSNWDSLVSRAYYTQGDFSDLGAYERLNQFLQGVDQEQQTPGSYLFYLATPPRFFGEIATRLGQSGLGREQHDSFRRIIIEKPFGRDLESARELNRTLHQSLAEQQIYRIDHYLGKETVQNILAYRFANSTVEPIWNHRYIDHVQITVAESLGVENRAGYYDEAGALRDMVPNHLLALLGVVAMEPPNSFNANEVRDEQSKVLRAIQPITPEDVLTKTVRGQYDAGHMPGGGKVPAYRDEPGIDPRSRTETFVAMKLKIDSWRWAGVPFYLRTGKCLPGRYTEVVIQYKHAPNIMFRDSLLKRANVPPNMLVLRLQPDEGIGMNFNAKIPGHALSLGTVQMNFRYEDYFDHAPATGYETLLHDCMTGDATLFKRADNIEASWELVDPVLEVWSALPVHDFPNYAAGTWGPAAGEQLLTRDGRAWHACEACKADVT